MFYIGKTLLSISGTI